MNHYAELAQIIKNSPSTVFFGGAGVSTESGVPDFRSETGLYAEKQVYGHSPEELLSRTFFKQEREMFYKYYKENMIYREVKPNPAHIALAKLEEAGLLKTVITQNIDGLHQAAGSVNVIELHGSNHRQYCLNCGEKYSLDYILDPANCAGDVPKCRICGGIVRPDVVLYEESLDNDIMNSAEKAITAAHCLIVGGTSLVVYPAASLLHYFKGDNLVLINKTATQYDSHAHLVIHEPIGKVFTAVLAKLGQ